MTDAEWAAHCARVMRARDEQELIYLDELRTAWQERDEARRWARYWKAKFRADHPARPREDEPDWLEDTDHRWQIPA